MQTVLKSNFRDCYDHWFCLEQDFRANYRFSRNTFSGPTREDMFKWMSFMSLSIPKYGQLKSLLKESNKEYFVVYLDQVTHRGEGKFLLQRKENFLCKKYEDYLSSEYMGLPNDKPKSLRYLSIGKEVFWLSYSSNDIWRSNCGDEINIEILDSSNDSRLKEIQAKIQKQNKHIPLLAIDFVEEDGILFGIDLNIAPQIGGTGIEELMKPKEMAEEIQRFIMS